MANKLKPIPKNQSELTQQRIEPYLTNQGSNANGEDIFYKNRGMDLSFKNDDVKDVSIGLQDIDDAVLFYFEHIIKPTVIQNSNRIAVPIIYGSPERWKSIQADGFYRDAGGKLMVPIIMLKRETVTKNRNIGNKLDGNKAHLYQVMGERYNSRNAYDKFDLLNNRIPSKQYYISPVPDYVTVTYNCIIFTDFVEQNNKIVEAVEFASDSYWGNPSRFKFRTSVDTFNTTTLLESGIDRAAKTSFTINLNGYIIPNTVNKDLAVASSKFYTKSQVVFTFETAESEEAFTTAGASASPKSAMGAASAVDSYNVNVVTTQTVNIDINVLIYLETNNTRYAVGITANTATFSATFLTAPSPLPSTSAANFTFFVNGQLVDVNSITSFIDNGNGTCTLTLSNAQLGYTLVSTDQVIAIGKF
jgi:hypothetical protein